ncbi:DUF4407 domain-containing protein [Rhodoplanes roseus]|nr:DUF4407 domain-containing protein [Rhodoplanes roseus]
MRLEVIKAAIEWFFKKILDNVSVDGCKTGGVFCEFANFINGFTLLTLLTVVLLVVLYFGVFSFKRIILRIVREFFPGATFRRQGSPKGTFDPFDLIRIPRPPVAESAGGRLWHALGTDPAMLVGAGYRDAKARMGLALSVLFTTALAVVGAFTFMSYLMKDQAHSWFGWAAVTLFGVLIYAGVIYSFDMSIVVQRKPSKAQMWARLGFALFMSILVGGQLNVDFHRQFLSARLEKQLPISETRDAIRKLEEEDLAIRNIVSTQTKQIAELDSDIRTLQLRKENKSLDRERADLQQAVDAIDADVKMLNCIAGRERSRGRWERACRINRPRLIALNLDVYESRVAGPDSPRCETDHRSSVYCRAQEKLAELVAQRGDANRKLQAFPVSADAIDTEIGRKEIEKRRSADLRDQELKRGENTRAALGVATGKLSEFEGRKSSSTAELWSSMWSAVSEFSGTGIWILILFIVLIVLDMFAVVSKYMWTSPVYDARLEAWEAMQLEDADAFVARFRTRFEEPPGRWDLLPPPAPA